MVSFIVPVYNAEKYLRQCIDSILAQSVKDLEIIIVDDGSTDNSGALSDDFAARDSRIKVVHQPNAGLSVARNVGLRHANGEFVSYVDADDAVHPLMAETLLGIIGDSDIAISRFIHGEEVDWLPIENSIEKMIPPSEAIRRVLYQDGLDNSVWGKLFRRELLTSFDFTKGIIYEDLDWFYHVYESSDKDIAYTSAVLYFYRNTPGSLINVFGPQRFDVLDVVDRIEEHYADDPVLAAAARDRKFAANFNMYILSRNKAEYSHYNDKCWATIKKYRREILRNKSSRAKNRIGAFLSYFGKHAINSIARIYS